ncbi:hypothetical protein ACIBH3_01845, partial [Kitasatospora sp. NPDC050543]
MDAEDRFEEDLVVRLSEQAGSRVPVGGVPLAELRQAGQRRLRRARVARAVAAVGVVAACGGMLAQLGGGGPAGGTSRVAGGPVAPAERTAGAGDDAGVGEYLQSCETGPSSVHTPGWTGPPESASGAPLTPSSSVSAGVSGSPSS